MTDEEIAADKDLEAEFNRLAGEDVESVDKAVDNMTDEEIAADKDLEAEFNRLAGEDVESVDKAVDNMTDEEIAADKELEAEFDSLAGNKGNEDLIDLNEEPEIIGPGNKGNEDLINLDEEPEIVGPGNKGNEDLINLDEKPEIMRPGKAVEPRPIDLQELNKEAQKAAFEALLEDIDNQVVKEELKRKEDREAAVDADLKAPTEEAKNIHAEEIQTRDEKANEVKYKLLKDNKSLSDEVKNELKKAYEQRKEKGKEFNKNIEKTSKTQAAFKEKYKEELEKRSNIEKKAEGKAMDQKKPAQQKGQAIKSTMPESSFEKSGKAFRDLLKSDSMQKGLFTSKEASNMIKAARSYEEALTNPKKRNTLEKIAQEFLSACDKYLNSMSGKQKDSLRWKDTYRIEVAKFGMKESKKLLDELKTAKECVAYNKAHKTNLTPGEFKKQQMIDKTKSAEKQQKIDKTKSAEKQQKIDKTKSAEKQQMNDKTKTTEKQQKIDKTKTAEKQQMIDKIKSVEKVQKESVKEIQKSVKELDNKKKELKNKLSKKRNALTADNSKKSLKSQSKVLKNNRAQVLQNNAAMMSMR
ncbi:MAG: hypothetical protein J6P05_05785, partial [Lachnospiraceae bacterium]|nr:hypothetical protein [Lachnospiraceae bacterium]